MKRTLFAILTTIALTLMECISCQGAGAPDRFSVTSFRALETDLDARLYPEFDQNGKKAALIKVVTNEKGFSFDVGIMGVVGTRQEVGEIWVYVPEGILKMTIRHKDYGVIRDFRLEIPVTSGSVYELKLHTPEKQPFKIFVPVRDTAYITVSREKTYSCRTFLTLQAGVAPDMSFGLAAGQHFIHKGSTMGGGWYMKVRSNFRFRDGYDRRDDSSDIWTMRNGTSVKSRLSLTAGGIWHCLKWLDLYSGAGYGKKNVVWEDSDGKMIRVDDRSSEGVAADFGAVFHIGKAALSAGICTAGSKYMDLEIGVGISF